MKPSASPTGRSSFRIAQSLPRSPLAPSGLFVPYQNSLIQTFSRAVPFVIAAPKCFSCGFTAPVPVTIVQWAAVSTSCRPTSVPVQPVSRRPIDDQGLSLELSSVRSSGPSTL